MWPVDSVSKTRLDRTRTRLARWFCVQKQQTTPPILPFNWATHGRPQILENCSARRKKDVARASVQLVCLRLGVSSDGFPEVGDPKEVEKNYHDTSRWPLRRRGIVSRIVVFADVPDLDIENTDLDVTST